MHFWPFAGLAPVPTTVSSNFSPLGVSVIRHLYSELARGGVAAHWQGGIADGGRLEMRQRAPQRDLASLLVERGPLPASLLADHVVQACLGLAEAHAGRIVHRD